MAPPTVDQILDLVHQLPSQLRRQLITRLEQELATESPLNRPPKRPHEARATWARLRESMHDLPTPRLTAGEQLETDRRDRERARRGWDAESDDT